MKRIIMLTTLAATMAFMLALAETASAIPLHRMNWSQ
jgi:hypothetical protein